MPGHTSIYTLQILLPGNLGTHEAVSQVLGCVPNDPSKKINWRHVVIEGPEASYFDFINEFLNILEEKYEALAAIGISREDITIWMEYAYDGQCNMEFSPQRLKRLGECGIKLCICCWDISEQNEDVDNRSTQA